MALRRHILLQDLLVVLLLFIWLLVLRAPFFAIPTIDADESTFIIVGQGILDGFLPYVKLWENKPPLVFSFFAAAIAIFGKSIPAIRFAGCLWLVAGSYFVFCCVRALTHDRLLSFATAMFAATIISLMSMWVSSELLAFTPLIAAQLVLFHHQEKLTKFYCCGLLIGIAGMFRTNLAYVAAFIGLYIALFGLIFWSIRETAARLGLYVVGGFTVIAFTATPYAITGQLDMWFKSVFLAPWHFESERFSYSNILIPIIAASRISYWPTPQVTSGFVAVTLWAGAAVGVLSGLFLRKQNNARINLVFFGGIVTSILLTGQFFPHHNIQLVPWMLMSAAIGLNLVPLSNRRSMIVVGILLLVSAHAIFSLGPKYADLQSKIVKNEDIFSSPEMELASFLRHENAQQHPIYLVDQHIVYWLVGQHPLTRMSTHPSTIVKPAFIEAIEGPKSTPEGEMKKILAAKPEFIIKPTREIWYFLHSAPKISEILNQALSREYYLLRVLGGREIYRKKSVNE